MTLDYIEIYVTSPDLTRVKWQSHCSDYTQCNDREDHNVRSWHIQPSHPKIHRQTHIFCKKKTHNNCCQQLYDKLTKHSWFDHHIAKVSQNIMHVTLSHKKTLQQLTVHLCLAIQTPNPKQIVRNFHFSTFCMETRQLDTCIQLACTNELALNRDRNTAPSRLRHDYSTCHVLCFYYIPQVSLSMSTPVNK